MISLIAAIIMGMTGGGSMDEVGRRNVVVRIVRQDQLISYLLRGIENICPKKSSILTLRTVQYVLSYLCVN